MDKCERGGIGIHLCDKAKEAELGLKLNNGNEENILYCPYCGEPLKEPIPERVDPYIQQMQTTGATYQLNNSIKSAHDRIDYILRRLEE